MVKKLCVFCNCVIPKSRFHRNHFIPRYCSRRCIGNAWLVKRRNTKSVIRDGPHLESCTGKGLYWEMYAQKILGGEVLSLKTMNRKYDLVLDDGRTVDVKSCNLYRRNKKRGKKILNIEKQIGWWVFNKNKGNEALWYFLVGLIENRPSRLFLIPKEEFKSGVCISRNSNKFKEYELHTYCN